MRLRYWIIAAICVLVAGIHSVVARAEDRSPRCHLDVDPSGQTCDLRVRRVPQDARSGGKYPASLDELIQPFREDRTGRTG